MLSPAHDAPEELDEREFIERVRARDVCVSRRQLRNLKDTKQIRGAVQKHTPGLRGSRSSYLASEVDRVVALLTVPVPGRRTARRVSHAAWLAQGERALPLGKTSRSFIIEAIESSRDAISKDSLGSQLMQLIREPADLDAPEPEPAEAAYNLVESVIEKRPNSMPLPLLDLLMHCLVVKDYIELLDTTELHPVAEVFGPLYDEHTDHRLFNDDFLRQPLSAIMTDPLTALSTVDDVMIERAREIIASLVGSFSKLTDLTKQLTKLKVPISQDLRTLTTAGQLLSPRALEASPMIVAHFAQKMQQEPDLESRAHGIVASLGAPLEILQKIKSLVEADPTVLTKLKQGIK